MAARSTLETEERIRVTSPVVTLEVRDQAEYSPVLELRPLRKGGKIPVLALVLVVLAVAMLLSVPYLIIVHLLLS